MLRYIALPLIAISLFPALGSCQQEKVKLVGNLNGLVTNLRLKKIDSGYYAYGSVPYGNRTSSRVPRQLTAELAVNGKLVSGKGGLGRLDWTRFGSTQDYSFIFETDSSPESVIAVLLTADGQRNAFAVPKDQRITSIPVIDCHVHLWDTKRPEMTWPPKGHRLFRSFLPKKHEPICKANAVTGVVVVLSGQALVDNQWNLDVTAHNKELYRGVVGNMSLAIGTDKFEPLFRTLCKDRRYVGYRLSGREQKGITDELIRDLKLTAKMGRTVDFLIGQYSLQDVEQIAKRVPELKIIIDHFGGVRLNGGPHDEQWVRDFEAIAKRPNVYCKFSALYGRFRKQPAPMDLTTYKPTMDLAMKWFGEDRLVYGSDWPVTTQTGDYESVIKLTRSYFADKDIKVARKVLHNNAVKFYGLDRPETP